MEDGRQERVFHLVSLWEAKIISEDPSWALRYDYLGLTAEQAAEAVHCRFGPLAGRQGGAREIRAQLPQQPGQVVIIESPRTFEYGTAASSPIKVAVYRARLPERPLRFRLRASAKHLDGRCTYVLQDLLGSCKYYAEQHPDGRLVVDPEVTEDLMAEVRTAIEAE